MEKKMKATEDYRLFGSQRRGEAEVEQKIKSVLAEKETVDNISTFSRAVSKEWNCSENNVSRLKLAFADLEKKIEKLKPELARQYAAEKEKMAPRGKHRSYIHDSNAI
ncbi:hypothetical protein [Dyadobacter psychrotolerans]|uniref:Uncharacterized protein n=1 Tax=Dyadobacter psychrotolerans TaxID=2541721 RepID=A0A4R5DE27_9BACT|nr:hypothetical protein [Dyadobacter psychrotolerans]TDE11327.1 hypothetical protein E0F88_25785 [Dyadobacter psychrotolerans]